MKNLTILSGFTMAMLKMIGAQWASRVRSVGSRGLRALVPLVFIGIPLTLLQILGLSVVATVMMAACITHTLARGLFASFAQGRPK